MVAGHLVTALQGETYQSEIQTSPIEPQQSVQPIEPPSAVHQQSSDDETQLPPKKCHAKGDSDEDFLPSDDNLPELSSDDSDTDSEEELSSYVRAIPPINSAHSRSCSRNQKPKPRPSTRDTKSRRKHAWNSPSQKSQYNCETSVFNSPDTLLVQTEKYSPDLSGMPPSQPCAPILVNSTVTTDETLKEGTQLSYTQQLSKKPYMKFSMLTKWLEDSDEEQV